MKELRIEENKWEELATDISKWKSYLQATLKDEKKYYLRKQTQAQERKLKNCQPCSSQNCAKLNH